MLNIDLMRRKLARMNMYLTKLEPFTRTSFDEYTSDFYAKTSVERIIQLIVECATDINNHVVVQADSRPPEDYRSSFVRAADLGLISRDLADRLKGSAGLRNIIVHDYMEIDDEIVFGAIQLTIKGYREYLIQVDAFIDKTDTHIDKLSA